MDTPSKLVYHRGNLAQLLGSPTGNDGNHLSLDSEP
jgi:hypothetical protein